jgi:putative lipoprotein
MALPADSTVTVRVEDVSRADAPAEVLGEQTIAAAGRQVPIPFELEIPGNLIQANHRYALRAEIRTGAGLLLFTTTSHHPVITEGAPTEGVDLMLQRVSGTAAGAAGPSSQPSLDGRWRLVGFRGEGQADEAIGADPPYTLEFLAEGRIAGQAHCNRYFGGYERSGPAELEFTGVGATLAMCAAPSLSSEFLRALDGVRSYELDDERLKLPFGQGGLLTFERDAEPVAAAAPEVGRTFVYDCPGGASFTVRSGPGELALWAPEQLGSRYVVLSQEASSSGAHYTEGDVSFASKDDQATIEFEGQRFEDCEANPAKAPWADAKRRGVTFRALGQEPAWVFEVQGRDLLVLITDLGATRHEFPFQPPAVDGATTTYRSAAGAGELVASVTRSPCADTMSGEAFDVAATIAFGGETLRGCGRFL